MVLIDTVVLFHIPSTIYGNYFKHKSLKASFKYQVNNNPLNIHFIVGYVFAVVAHYAVPFTPIFIVYVYAAI